jgi:hypothetical protein
MTLKMSSEPVPFLALLVGMAALAPATLADPLWLGNPELKVHNKVPLKAAAFDLRDVRLLDGPFRHALELDHQYLLKLDVDRLLHNFRRNAGLPSQAQPLGGWEEPACELRGHFVGHYLSACALMYASTADDRLKTKADLTVAGLAECQTKLGHGYLSAFPETFFDRVEQRKRVWAPYYTLHKICAGLLDTCVYCQNRQALEVCCRLADWVIARNARLSEAQMQEMLGNEHGGMNEVLANLYALTGQEKYLKIAQRFNHMAVLGPAAKGEDRLTGLHANTQIPKFIGAARQYELTGEDWLRRASVFFWDTVVKERSYVIGGHSDGEMFSPKEKLSQALGPNTTETCNTYNMLKLTRHLFCWEPHTAYADYYERALYNHIIASQNPENGMTCYYVPLRTGSRKSYSDEFNSFWCCTGTGVENHAKYGDSIYFHDGEQSLYVNLFIHSELNWKAKGIKLRQDTSYPDRWSSTLVFTCRNPVEFNLMLRHPYWAEKGLAIKINGRPERLNNQPGSWVSLTRTWRSGDTVLIEMPFTLRSEGFKDNPRRLAILHGPLVLAAQVDPKRPYPAILAEDIRFLSTLRPVAGRPNTFTGTGETFHIAGDQSFTGVTLEPFYKIHGNRYYAVYWDVLTRDQWQIKEQQYAAEVEYRRALEARTVDQVKPGEEQSERDHNLQGNLTNSGDFGDHKYRDAREGGWFSWDLKVLPGRQQQIVLTYWGDDRGRDFDIIVDGHKVATQRLTGSHPGTYYDEVYPLSPELTRGKEKITLKVQASPETWAGGVFGVRVLADVVHGLTEQQNHKR